MKVYGGDIMKNGIQWRAICYTKSKNSLSKITKQGIYYINNYWCETGNNLEMEIAKSKPNALFITRNDFSAKTKDDFTEMTI
jgi:hypothetical protein